ncbi:hypothetical protein B0A54_03896 [Friedmanniomyces endolithicus]|uniref:Uncharacterized protein n=1 Tax=Friedmanniomyces endolithicus TaxID=329885 RepID=A0A4U0VD43_9PEZI|nr:hypothetical protein B0A54_03896 [Friedmanniomyces endolithicus]
MTLVKHAGELLEVRSAHERELLSSKGAQAAEMEKAHTEHARGLEAIRDELQQAHASEEAKLQSQHETKIQEITASLQEKHISQLTKLQTKHERHLQQSTDALRNEHGVELERTKADGMQSLQEMKDEHAQERERLITEHQVAVEKVRSDLPEQVQSATDRLSDGHKVELDRMRNDHEAHVRTLNADLEHAKTEGTKLQSQARESQAAHTKEIEDMRSRNEIDSSTLQSQLEDVRLGAKQAREKSQAKLADLAGRLATECKASKALREQMQRAEQSHRERVKDLESAMSELEQRLSTAEETFSNTTAALQAKEAELNAQISAKEEELVEARQGLSSLQADTDAESGRLGEEISAREGDLAKTIQDHKTQLQQLNDQHIRETEELNVEHNAALDGVQQTLSESLMTKDAELAVLRKRHEGLTEALDSAQLRHNETANVHAGVLQEIHAKHLREVEELRVQHAAKVDHAREESRVLVEEAACSHSGALKTLLEQHEEASATARHAGDEQLEQLRSEKDLEAQRLLSEHDDVLKTVKQTHSDELTELRQRNEGSLLSAKRDGDAEVRRLNDVVSALKQQHEKTLQAAKQDRDAGVQQASSQHAKEMNARQAEHGAMITSLEQGHITALDQAQKQHDLTSEEAKREADSCMQKLKEGQDDEKIRLIAEQKTAHDKSVEDVEVRAQSTIHDARSEAEQQREEDSQRHQTELRDLHAQIRLLTEEHQTAFDDAIAEHASAIAGIRTSHDKERDTMEKQHDEAVSSHESALDALRREQEETTKTTRRIYEDETSKLQDALSSAQAAHETELARSNDEHAKQMHTYASGWSSKADEAASKHHADIQSAIANAISETTAKAREDLGKQLAERDAAAEAHLAAVRESHADELAKAREGDVGRLDAAQKSAESSKAELNAARAEHERDFDQMQATLSEQLAQIKIKHNTESQRLQRDVEDERQRSEQAQRARDTDAGRLDAAQKAVESGKAELNAARVEHERDSDQMQATFSEQLAQIKVKHNTESQRLQRDVEDERQRSEQVHQQAAAELLSAQGSHAASTDLLKAQLKDAEERRKVNQSEIEAQRLQATNVSDAMKSSEIQSIQREHQSSLVALRQTLEIKFRASQAAHHRELADVQGTLRLQTEAANGARKQALVDRDVEWAAKMASLKKEQAESFSDILQTNDASTVEHTRELERQHREALSHAVEGARAEAAQNAAAAEKEHQQSLQGAMSEAKQTSDEEMKRLIHEHEDAVAGVRGEVEKQSQARIAELNSEHEAALAQATAVSDKGVATRSEAHREEVATLRSHLEAEVTGHTGVREALADVRSQRSEDGERVVAAKDDAERRLAILQEQHEALKLQHSESTTSVREIQAILPEAKAKVSAPGEPSEVTALRQQLALAEQDRKQAQAFVHQKLDEKSELAQQNDALLKEIQALKEHLSSSERPQAAKSVNAQVQTDFVGALPSWRTLPECSATQHNGVTNANASTELDLTQATGENDGRRMDPSTPQSTRRTLAPSQPTTPSRSQKRVADLKSEPAWKTRSFEDYLQQAKTELSELGSVITANEALFARKIQEHVGDLQRAKDHLAAEYKDKFDTLLAEKSMREKDAMSRGVEDFTKERNQLLASNGIEHDEPQAQNALLTSLPLKQAKELRTAEERLVSEYNRRIAERKSQIALKHAEDFQFLTQDYDRKIIDLLNDKEKLEGDLSVEPERFEHDLDDFEVKSVQLEVQKSRSVRSSPQLKREVDEPSAAAQVARTQQAPIQRPTSAISALPQRVVISTPHTPSSIPAARPFFPGSRGSADATSQPRSGRVSTTAPRTPASPTARRESPSERYPPLPQRSLMRVRSPADGPIPRRVVSTPRTSEKWASPSSAKENDLLDLSLGPETAEQHAQQSLIGKVSIASPKTSTAAEGSSGRKLRHSSGSTFGQAFTRD